jgi:uncharacterized protein YxjI
VDKLPNLIIMGLDQYIEIEVVHQTVNTKKQRVVTERSDETLAYFRKVNFIQKFFEDKYEIPDDERVRITKEDLRELADLCERVIDKFEEWDGAKEALESDDYIEPPKHIQDYADELLPTCEGFFFGSTDYDNWYFNDVKDTMKTIREVIQEVEDTYEVEDADNYQLFYRAWW